MRVVKGSLWITTEGLELLNVPEDERDRVVLEFFEMKTEAERCNDKFYALQDIFTHHFSYGNFCSDFLYPSWPDFHACKSLAKISQSTYQFLQSFSQRPLFNIMESEEEFSQKEYPRDLSGFGYAVCNLSHWTEWHRAWYAEHPKEIDWTDAGNGWMPRLDLTLKILRRELLKKFEEKNDSQEAQLLLLQISDECVAHEFHEKVMRHQGKRLEAFASEIGRKICVSNYYTHEKELSAMEHRIAKSLRQIYSIIGPHGRRQFISIDFRHGMFEFHDEDGNHLGEFRFDGTWNSDADSSHSLKCVKPWLKRRR